MATSHTHLTILSCMQSSHSDDSSVDSPFDILEELFYHKDDPFYIQSISAIILNRRVYSMTTIQSFFTNMCNEIKQHIYPVTDLFYMSPYEIETETSKTIMKFIYTHNKNHNNHLTDYIIFSKELNDDCMKIMEKLCSEPGYTPYDTQYYTLLLTEHMVSKSYTIHIPFIII